MSAVTLMHGDCLERMAAIADGSVDMVLCDLPYGTTQNAWDAVIPFDALWEHYWRVCKPSAAIVLTAAQPFTSALVMSQPKEFRYQWVWEKAKATGFLNAKKQPLRAHEDVLVFYKCLPTYSPQMTMGEPYSMLKKSCATGSYGSQANRAGLICASDGERYPRSVLKMANSLRVESVHPTQKPVELMEYLIRTYTHAGETVLDSTMGSGTTGVEAVNLGRSFVGIERDAAYFEIAQQRIAAAGAADLFRAPVPIDIAEPVDVVTLDLFEAAL